MNSITVFILLSTIGLSYCGSCPPADQILPCTCDGDHVKCVLTKEFDLEELFETFQRYTTDLAFDQLELSSTELTELGADVFQGAMFRHIHILNGPKLSCINPRAFTGMEKFTESFDSTFSNFSDFSKDCDIFAALSRLEYMRTISITGSSIKAIPEKAFRAKQNTQLTSIDFSGKEQGGVIEKIGKNAFAELKVLTNIDLSYHKISFIDSFAFSFNDRSTNTMKINLKFNPSLSGSSFGKSAFETNGRITAIDLSSNTKLKYLDESVFHSFLENKDYGKNMIEMRGTFMDLVQDNEWLVELKASLHLQDKLTNIMASDGQPLWKHSKIEFKSATTGPPSAAPLSTLSGSTVRGSPNSSTPTKPSTAPPTVPTTIRKL